MTTGAGAGDCAAQKHGFGLAVIGMLKESSFAARIQSWLGKSLSFLPLSPTQLTLSSVLFASAGLWLSFQSHILAAFALFLAAASIDALDGALARARGQVSAKGAYLDGISDRLVEFLLLLSFFPHSPPDFILPSGILLFSALFFGSAMASFATAYADHRKAADSKKIAAQPGILPRAERLSLLLLSFLSLSFLPALSSALLFLAAALSAITFLQRVIYFCS
ncbi:MAG: CDP-alcohol phosphatidyltransferase family protein [Candidatus Micrarchaeota archaeon]|nr:CDP-alcohol phosphatidyltransferase family protein [Candidatus Micrarchaeota archaeon]